jgi:hypothetical protein
MIKRKKLGLIFALVAVAISGQASAMDNAVQGKVRENLNKVVTEFAALNTSRTQDIQEAAGPFIDDASEEALSWNQADVPKKLTASILGLKANLTALLAKKQGKTAENQGKTAENQGNKSKPKKQTKSGSGSNGSGGTQEVVLTKELKNPYIKLQNSMAPMLMDLSSSVASLQKKGTISIEAANGIKGLISGSRAEVKERLQAAFVEVATPWTQMAGDLESARSDKEVLSDRLEEAKKALGELEEEHKKVLVSMKEPALKLRDTMRAGLEKLKTDTEELAQSIKAKEERLVELTQALDALTQKQSEFKEPEVDALLTKMQEAGGAKVGNLTLKEGVQERDVMSVLVEELDNSIKKTFATQALESVWEDANEEERELLALSLIPASELSSIAEMNEMDAQTLGQKLVAILSEDSEVANEMLDVVAQSFGTPLTEEEQADFESFTQEHAELNKEIVSDKEEFKKLGAQSGGLISSSMDRMEDLSEGESNSEEENAIGSLSQTFGFKGTKERLVTAKKARAARKQLSEETMASFNEKLEAAKKVFEEDK